MKYLRSTTKECEQETLAKVEDLGINWTNFTTLLISTIIQNVLLNNTFIYMWVVDLY